MEKTMFLIKAKHIDGSTFRHNVDTAKRKDDIVSHYTDYKFITAVEVIEYDKYAIDVA